MTVLAFETVGTSEIQGGLFDGFVAATVGQGPRISGRAIGEELARLSNEELRGLIDYDDLRNGACYRELDKRADGAWTLALLATDQPEKHPGDTFGIAIAIRRWFSLARPNVSVLEPLRVTARPDQPGEELERQVDEHLTGALARCRPERLVILPVGGTPVMRLVVEHRAGRLSLDESAERWVPDGVGGYEPGGLLRTIEAQTVRDVGYARLREAIGVGRWRAARDHAEDLRKLRLVARDTVNWCRVGERIVSRERPWTEPAPPDSKTAKRIRRVEGAGGGWVGLVAAELAHLRRAEKDGRLRDAVVAFVSVSETVPIAFLFSKGIVRSDGDVGGVPPPASDCPKRFRPTHTSHPQKARNAILCANDPCEFCWIARDKPLAKRLAKASGRHAAGLLRDGSVRDLVDLRNRLIHPGLTTETGSAITAAIDSHAKALRDIGLRPEHTMSGLLDTAIRESLGRLPADPLDLVEVEVERLLG